MMDETRLDNELAAFTDRLLAGEDTQAAPESDELAQVVRQFHQVIQPDSGPNSAFREHLAQRLDQEWDLIQQDSRPAIDEPQIVPTQELWQEKLAARRSSHSRFSGLRNRNLRIAAIAATIAAALFVAVLIATNDDTSQSGTANGDISLPVIVGVVVVALLSVIVFWLGQRSKS